MIAEPDAPATAAKASMPSTSFSGVPREIKFSSVLRNSSGKPVTNVVAVTFALYDKEEGGTGYWSETQNVEPDAQGHYSVMLGARSGSGVPMELFQKPEGIWLGVRVLEPGQTEQPRVRWVSVPYALKAGDAETLGGRPASSYVVNSEAQVGSTSAAAPTPLATTVTGSGTAGFISKFLTSTTVGNSVVFEKTGNIGLGTTSPVSKLSVVGNITATGSIAAGGILSLPKTTSASAGVLNLGGIRFLHAFGGFNTFVGAAAGNMTMTGAGENTVVGTNAFQVNTSGCCNSALGAFALQGNSLGSYNSAFGASALSRNTTGFRNSAFGALALDQIGGGNDNAAFGVSALFRSVTDSENSAFGNFALNAMTNGSANSAFGYNGLHSITAGAGNSAFGKNALGSITSGSFNIAIGSGSGFYLTTGNHNIYLGYWGAAPFAESGTIRVGNGNQTATFIDGIVGQTIASGTAVFIDNAGHLGVFTSSKRFKNDITDMATESDLLMQLRPVAFYYKPELDDTHTRQYGLVAEEVAKIAPQLVVFDENGAPQTVRYHFVNAMLLNEVQKQRRLVEEQQQTIAQQEATLQDLAARLAKLEAVGHEQ